jgi:hypothetical protein
MPATAGMFMRLPGPRKPWKNVSSACYPLASESFHGKTDFKRNAARTGRKALVSFARPFDLLAAPFARAAHSHTT